MPNLRAIEIMNWDCTHLHFLPAAAAAAAILTKWKWTKSSPSPPTHHHTLITMKSHVFFFLSGIYFVAKWEPSWNNVLGLALYKAVEKLHKTMRTLSWADLEENNCAVPCGENLDICHALGNLQPLGPLWLTLRFFDQGLLGLPVQVTIHFLINVFQTPFSDKICWCRAELREALL